MKYCRLFLCILLMSSCAPLEDFSRITHSDRQKAAGRQEYFINTPQEIQGFVEEQDAQVPVSKVQFRGNTGWAIDYHVMYVARSDDQGKTWHVIETDGADPAMPWGLHVPSEMCAWIWGSYTTETDWYSTESTIIVTHDKGKTWYQLPRVVDFLYNLKVLSEYHAIIIGRVRPNNWPMYSDPLTLPVVQFETFDGGKTFKQK